MAQYSNERFGSKALWGENVLELEGRVESEVEDKMQTNRSEHRVKTQECLSTNKTQYEGIENLKANKRNIFNWQNAKAYKVRKSKNGSNKHRGYILSTNATNKNTLESLSEDELF